MNLYCSDKLLKQIPKEMLESVLATINNIAYELYECDSPDVLKNYDNRQMVGVKNIWKFRTDQSNRIVWAYGKHLSGTREAEKNDIFLLAYSVHDLQVRTATSLSKDVNRRNFYLIKAGLSSDYEDIIKSARLTNTQEEYINSLLPLLISGGAGNGKTLVSIYKLIKLNNTYGSDKTAYFTLTEKLRSSAMETYKKITGGENFSSFYKIHDYLIDFLKFNHKSFVQYPAFKKWFLSKYKKEALFESMDVWVEIRGTIKGYMGAGWKRNTPFSMSLINEKTKNYLLKRNFIKYFSNDNKILRCRDFASSSFVRIIKTVESDTNLVQVTKKRYITDILKIKKWVEDKEFINPLLNETDYHDLDNDVSKFNKKEKSVIYGIVKEYQKWLDKSGKYDDNDIARNILKLSPDKIFEYIVIDEVQDLPEIQIMALLSLIGDKRNAVFSGDIHQVLQPNVFSENRLNSLYKNQMNLKYLNVNHRSQGQIVDFTNELSGLRRNLIGNRKKESELREEAVWKGLAPFLLNKSEENVLSSIKELCNYSNAAIVTSNEKEKKHLQNLVSDGKPIVNMYTVEEIKGLEFNYIFCYNLIGDNKEYWEEIFEEKIKHSGKYRYYFNQLYVASTRARETLCFCEANDLYGVEELGTLFKKTIRVKKFNKNRLNINKEISNSDDWFERAIELEKYGVYDRASLYYSKAGHDQGEKRCNILNRNKINEIDHREAIDKLYDMEENEIAYNLAKKYNDHMLKFRGYIKTKNFSITEIERLFSEKYIMKFYLNNKTKKRERKILQKNYLEKKIGEVKSLLINTTEKIKEQTGGEQ